AAIQGGHVLPLHALTKLEGPDTVTGLRLPRLREVPDQGEIVGPRRLVREPIAHEPVAHEAGELEEPDRLGQPGVNDRRVPRRSPRYSAATFRRLGARGDPVRV